MMSRENEGAENVVIIGSGPAGHTAAIYAARADLRPLLYEGFMAGGIAAGGQLTTTTDVENYPGFPEGIQGPQLMEEMRRQSTRFGTRIRTETVAKVDLSQRPFRLWNEAGDEVRTKSLVIATGATAKTLDLPGVERLWQKGISACAICDGALPVFRDRPLVVIGGGDSACEESLYLSKFGSEIHMLVRRDQMRASRIMQQRVQDNPKITVHWNTLPVEVLGDELVSGVRVKDKHSGEQRVIEAGGLFFAIGHQPNTAFLEGQLEADEVGYLKTPPDSTRTSVEGVFACGDVKDKVFRQAVTAAGSGCMAAIEAERWLAEQGA